jgi:acyl-CoA thioester hydrolase
MRNEKYIRTQQVELVVPFHDLDAMQVVWHGNYLNYFDLARNALFESAGLDMYRYGRETGYLFPITKVTTKHIQPLRFKDRLICSVGLLDAHRKLVMDFEIRKAEDGKLCAKCTTEQVTVNHNNFKMEIEVPQDIRQALSAR